MIYYENIMNVALLKKNSNTKKKKKNSQHFSQVELTNFY